MSCLEWHYCGDVSGDWDDDGVVGDCLDEGVGVAARSASSTREPSAKSWHRSAESPRRPPRHRRDTCSMAWRSRAPRRRRPGRVRIEDMVINTWSATTTTSRRGSCEEDRLVLRSSPWSATARSGVCGAEWGATVARRCARAAGRYGQRATRHEGPARAPLVRLRRRARLSGAGAPRRLRRRRRRGGHVRGGPAGRGVPPLRDPSPVVIRPFVAARPLRRHFPAREDSGRCPARHGLVTRSQAC